MEIPRIPARSQSVDFVVEGPNYCAKISGPSHFIPRGTSCTLGSLYRHRVVVTVNQKNVS